MLSHSRLNSKAEVTHSQKIGGGGRREGGGTLRVGLYREAFWLPLCDSIGLTYKDPCPEFASPSLDRFLWGGTYTTVTHACAPANATVFYAYLGCSVLAVCLLICPCLWPWMYYHVWIKFDSFLAYIGSVFLGCLLLAWGLTRPAIATMHRDLQTAVDDGLAPYFRRAGLRLQLHQHKVNRFRSETYLTIEPLGDGADNQGRSHRDPTLTDRRRETFRVPAYGTCVDRAIWRHISDLCELHTFGMVRHGAVKAGIDIFTWGAVATELHPLTSQYELWRASATVVLWASIELLVVGIVLGLVGYLIALVLMFFIVFPVLAPHLERLVLHWPERATLLALMEAKVQELAPEIANFSGYRLDFGVEKDTCGTLSGYVIFRAMDADHGWEPLGGSPSALQAVGATVV